MEMISEHEIAFSVLFDKILFFFIIAASLDIFNNKSHTLDYPSRKNNSSKGQYNEICFQAFHCKIPEYQKLVMVKQIARMKVSSHL